MRAAAVVAYAFALNACTIGPAAGANGESADAARRSAGDQCQDVLTEFCVNAAQRCGIFVAGLQDCINNFLPLCCTGSQCAAASPTSEATVSACKQTFDSEDCNLIMTTTNPGACLQLR